MISNPLINKAIGALFLGAILFYATGNAFLESALNAPDFPARLPQQGAWLSAGGLLIFLNSAAVAAIGVLMAQIIPPEYALTARFYLVSRLTEAVLLLFGVLVLLGGLAVARRHGGDPAMVQPLVEFARTTHFYAYQSAMLTLGIGSTGLCYILLKGALIPRYLAWWGLAGYAIFSVGAVLEFWDIKAGLILSIPGGLFELFFGGWWLFKKS